MRLFHVMTVPVSLAFLNGQASFAREHGFEVHIVTSPGPRLHAFAAAEGALPHALSMRRSVSPLADLVALVRLFSLFLRYRPRIVHAHTPKAGLLAMIAAWAARVPVRVFSVHGHPHSTASGILRGILRASTAVSCAAATRVFCVSDSSLRLTVAECGCPPHKVAVPANGSSNGVDAAGWFVPRPENRGPSRATLGLDPHSLVIGFAGRLVRDKGICELHEAWQSLRSRFPAAHLVIAGSAEKRDAVPQAILDGLANDPRVHLFGWIEDMRPFYEALDVLALPSHREGLPNVLLEAAAMRVPVVAARSVGCVDAVADGVTGILVAVADARALARALEAYLALPDLRTQHGAAARARILADFNPRDVRVAILHEYQTLLARPARPLRNHLPGRFAKRLLDLFLASLALLASSPVLLAVACLVRATLGAPVLFRQRRPGLAGRSFQILKFRTMRNALDAAGHPLPDAARLTRLGAFLRRSSLDELPELWNVIRGQMSLVGPRPLLPQYLPRYNSHQRRRHLVKPGITGWAQVKGRNALSWEEKLDADVWYVDHQSLSLDLRILWLTVSAVLRRQGIAHEGHATMPEFTGSPEPAGIQD